MQKEICCCLIPEGLQKEYRRITKVVGAVAFDIINIVQSSLVSHALQLSYSYEHVTESVGTHLIYKTPLDRSSCVFQLKGFVSAGTTTNLRTDEESCCKIEYLYQVTYYYATTSTQSPVGSDRFRRGYQFD